MIHPTVGAVIAVIALVSFSFALRRLMAQRVAGRTFDRLGLDKSKVVKERSSILARPVERLAGMAIGMRLINYAKEVHPQVAPSDVIAWAMCGLLGGTMVGVVLFPASPLVAITAIGGPVILDRVGRAQGSRTLRRLEESLPEALHIQASALRAGHSTTRSLAIVSAELDGPLGRALQILVQGIEMGEPLDVVLMAMSRRLMSRDVELWVTAMLVHRVTGGNLTVVLDSLAERLRQRQQLKAEVRALTAQARMSGVVVAAAPAAFFILLSITSREQMSVLFTTPVGMILLMTGLAMQGLGFLWIRRILKVKT